MNSAKTQFSSKRPYNENQALSRSATTVFNSSGKTEGSSLQNDRDPKKRKSQEKTSSTVKNQPSRTDSRARYIGSPTRVFEGNTTTSKTIVQAKLTSPSKKWGVDDNSEKITKTLEEDAEMHPAYSDLFPSLSESTTTTRSQYRSPQPLKDGDMSFIRDIVSPRKAGSLVPNNQENDSAFANTEPSEKQNTDEKKNEIKENDTVIEDNAKFVERPTLEDEVQIESFVQEEEQVKKSGAKGNNKPVQGSHVNEVKNEIAHIVPEEKKEENGINEDKSQEIHQTIPVMDENKQDLQAEKPTEIVSPKEEEITKLEEVKVLNKDAEIEVKNSETHEVLLAKQSHEIKPEEISEKTETVTEKNPVEEIVKNLIDEAISNQAPIESNAKEPSQETEKEINESEQKDELINDNNKPEVAEDPIIQEEPSNIAENFVKTQSDEILNPEQHELEKIPDSAIAKETESEYTDVETKIEETFVRETTEIIETEVPLIVQEEPKKKSGNKKRAPQNQEQTNQPETMPQAISESPKISNETQNKIQEETPVHVHTENDIHRTTEIEPSVNNTQHEETLYTEVSQSNEKEDKNQNEKKKKNKKSRVDDGTMSLVLSSTLGSSVIGFTVAKYGLGLGKEKGIVAGLSMGLLVGGISWLFKSRN